MKAFINNLKFEFMFMKYVELCVFFEQKKTFDLDFSHKKEFNINKIK